MESTLLSQVSLFKQAMHGASSCARSPHSRTLRLACASHQKDERVSCTIDSQISVPSVSSQSSEEENWHLQRRKILVGGVILLAGLFSGDAAEARRQRDRTNIPVEEYQTSTDSGLQYFDLAEGKGAPAEKGDKIVVHFDVVYKSITVVSSRASKLLGGNRTIAEPYELTVGAVPGRERKREFTENANGLFSAQAAPKPPAALYSITEGMRVGGKRTVIVPPEVGYGDKGLNEIPPGATVELTVELLKVQG